MCGRFVVSLPDLAALVEEFGVIIDQSGTWSPRFNIAPTQLAPVITNEPSRTLAQMRFGLMPFWARPKHEGSKQRGPANMINARVETLASKPAYKKALAARRCVVPVSGYYEWQKVGSHKRPLFIRAKHGGVIPLSGVWERWITRDGEVVESFAIVTRESDGFLRDIHDRMPLALPKGALDSWLDPDPKSADELAAVLQAPSHVEELVAHPVSQLVNSVANDGPELIAPVEAKPPPQLELFATEPARTATPTAPAKQKSHGASRARR